MQKTGRESEPFQVGAGGAKAVLVQETDQQITIAQPLSLAVPVEDDAPVLVDRSIFPISRLHPTQQHGIMSTADWLRKQAPAMWETLDEETEVTSKDPLRFKERSV